MNRKLIFWSLGAAVLIAVIVAGLALHTSHKAVSGPIKTISTPKITPKTNQNAVVNNQPVAPNPDQKTVTSTPNTNNELVAPYGSFVSNHRPGQNGSDLNEVSQCSTTQGASCSIEFKQGDIVKTLQSKTVDATGSVFWTWNVKDAGLTSGNWSVTATARLNGQTKETTDQLPLVVQ